MALKDPAERHKRVVLLVDSNVDDRFSISMLLQRFDCTIFTAHSADEAIEFMCVAPPAAIVSEAVPTGYDLLSRFKKESRFSNVPLILLLSHEQPLEKNVSRGEMAAILRKPVDVEAFYRIVEEVIHKGPRRNMRTATYLMANLEDDLGQDDGYVTVLSEFGMFFRTLAPRPLNTRVGVHFGIKGREIRIEAVVLYITSFNEGPFKEPGMGMKFVKISPEERELIRMFILERLEEGIGQQGPYLK